MNARPILWSLGLMAIAIVLQTTLFARLEQFYIIFDAPLLVVILAARWLDPDPELLLGFTGGLALDLLGTTPMGLRALVFVLVGYTAVRTSHRVEPNPVSSVLSVMLLSLLGVVLFAVFGTLFSLGSLTEVNILRTIVLVPLYNGALSLVVVPIFRWLVQPRKRGLV